MPGTHRVPVLVWQDFDGGFTACVVEDPQSIAAYGTNAQEALRSLKEYLDWIREERSWLPVPDFQDARLSQVKVDIRPEYHEQEATVAGKRASEWQRGQARIYPCPETVRLRVPCVTGRRESGLLVAALPTLSVRFDYFDAASLQDLATHLIKSTLKGLTPRQLSRCLAPRSVELNEVVLRFREDGEGWKAFVWGEELVALPQVAEPLISGRSQRNRFSPAWGRDREVGELVRRLNLERANVLIVGEPGAGKTTIVADASRKLGHATTDAEEAVAPKRPRLWLTNAGRLIAGMQYLGQWEERCEKVIGELSQFGGILCVENLLDLVRMGGQSPQDSLASFLLPYLQRGELHMVGEATLAELDACRRLLPGFADVFQVLTLPAFTREEATQVLTRMTDALGRASRLKSESGLESFVHRLFARFMPYSAFPGRSASFVRELFHRTATEKLPEVTCERALGQFVKQTGLPELLLRDEVRLEHRTVVESFRQRIIGQDTACELAARLVTTFKAGLNDPNRPLGVLLFCGPTGVGKTELAKTLSSYLFGHGEKADRLIRLDMSEYSTPGAADRLLSSPDGKPSQWIERVRQQPFSVVLLDEIEKATPEVFDVFLNVFDEGRLTDRYGRLTVFRSAILIMTSNLGATSQASLGFGDRPPAYESEAISFFRPEFFNRLDSVVTFQPLNDLVVLEITRKELAELSQREGMRKARLRLTWSDSLLRHLAERGFDRRYGARPLQRTIEREVVTPLARFLVEHPNLREAAIAMDWSAEGGVVFVTGEQTVV